MSDLGFRIGQALLGGDIDREGAFLEGLDKGSQINQRRAQTENALAQARTRRQEAEAKAQAGDALEAAGLPRELAPIVVGGMGSDFAGLQLGRQRGQDIDFRNVLADPNADVAARQGAGLGIRGTPVTAGDALGPGGELFMDVFNPGQPGVTPTGTAQIGADEALATQRLASAALSDKKRTNPELFRSQGATVNVNTPLAEQILPGLEGTSIVPDNINAEEGFGAEAVLKNMVNSVVDTMGGGVVFPDNAVANNVLAELSARTQIAMRADVPGGRPPVMVQELLARYAEDPAQLFRGDELARQNLSTTVASLKRSRDRVAQQLNSPTKKTPTRQGDLETALLNLSDTIADYDTILRSLEEKLGPIEGGAPATTDADGWITTPSGARIRAK